MRKTFFLSGVWRRSILPIGCVALTFFGSNHSSLAQATTEQPILITDEEVPTPAGRGEEEEEEEGGPPKVPDAYEVRLLLAQDFGEHVEWAMNWFFEKENTGDRGREWGFSQALMTPVLLPNERLKIGVEMEYRNLTVKDTRGD